ncbi:MAG: tetratricopeptide repeat protein [Rhodobacteraceae bacterium]|nr:tetratricopeptide repeat protein [Paracoccaceae bacterium]
MENQQTNRRLAAILAADVVGYSRLMAEDETGTLAALTHHRDMQFNPAVARHRGRVVKLMGDGTLVEFTSVVDAVNCAVDIQRAADPKITLRIGINLGDVIIQGDDIYGDGVNIAARLEPLAKPGGLCVSAIVNESVGARTEISFKNGGEVQVKNIDRPLKVWHWHPDDAGGGFDLKPVLAMAEPTTAQPSIAVLPFDNMSGDPEQEYFSDGMSEDIITDLSKVSGLMVIARNSSFAYKGRAMDLRVIGRELGVSAVLEGSVRKAGNRVRINAQLIDTATGGHLWADRYDRELPDIFAVQDEVTLEIVNALKVKLTPAEKINILESGTTNVAAHDLYLRAINLIWLPNLNAEIYQRVISYCEQAIALDPLFARAYSGIAVISVQDFFNGFTGNDLDTIRQRVSVNAARALELTPEDPLVMQVYAVAARVRRDLPTAMGTINKALKLHPNYAGMYFTRGEILVYSGQPQEAIPDLERASRQDPAFMHQHLQFLGVAHLLLGNFETAELVFRERIFLARDTDAGRAMLASVLGHLGKIDEARIFWQEAIEITPDFSMRKRMDFMTFEGHGDMSRVFEGLALAGLPID